MDGKIEPVVESVMQDLFEDSWLKQVSLSVSQLGYEGENQGGGWFLYMYRHMFISSLPSL